MHDYSLDTQVRRWVHVGIAVVALALPTLAAWATSGSSGPPVVAFPISFGVLFALFYYLFEEHMWKYTYFMHKIPNLNGEWVAEGRSSYKDPATGDNASFQMRLRIKQSFSRIEVFTETEDSTSRSFMASIEIEHAMPIFRYAFDNTPKNMADEELQRHPGMINLRIPTADLLEGDYFSGKHRLRFGELRIRRTSK